MGYLNTPREEWLCTCDREAVPSSTASKRRALLQTHTQTGQEQLGKLGDPQLKVPSGPKSHEGRVTQRVQLECATMELAPKSYTM